MAAIVAGEIFTRFSTTAGAAGNSTANTTVGTFLGKYMATSAWAGGGTNDVFPDITGAQNAANQVDYACLFVENTNALNAYQTCVVAIQSEVAGGASIALAVDTVAASAHNSASAQATQATTTTAPGGTVTGFTYGASATLGTLAAKSGANTNVRAFWIRRTAANSAALSTDGVTLSITGDTGSN